MIELTLASCSEQKIRRASKKPKTYAKYIVAYTATALPVDFLSRSMFPLDINGTGYLHGGQAISYEDLRNAGVKSIIVRFNEDRDTSILKIR